MPTHGHPPRSEGDSVATARDRWVVPRLCAVESVTFELAVWWQGGPCPEPPQTRRCPANGRGGEVRGFAVWGRAIDHSRCLRFSVLRETLPEETDPSSALGQIAGILKAALSHAPSASSPAFPFLPHRVASWGGKTLRRHITGVSRPWIACRPKRSNGSPSRKWRHSLRETCRHSPVASSFAHLRGWQ